MEAFTSNFPNNYDQLYFLPHSTSVLYVSSQFYTMILSPLVISNTADIITARLQLYVFVLAGRKPGW